MLYKMQNTVRADDVISAVQSMVSPQTEKKVMNLAQQLEHRGLEKGLQQGREQGMQQGMQKGMQQGMQLRNKEIAKKTIVE